MSEPASVVTRCPECLSAFRASTEQLAHANGQVCCGDCSAVFDGHAHQMLPPTPTQTPSPAPTPDTSAPPPAGNPDFRHWPTRRSGGLRGALAIALVIVFAGTATLAFTLRDTAARSLPAWRPWILVACQQLGCALAPLMELDALTIESSELRNDAGALTLVATLHNRLDYPVAAPAIAVSVADAAGVQLARDRLASARYLANRAELADGIAGGARLELSTRLAGNWPTAAIYQLQLGYR